MTGVPVSGLGSTPRVGVRSAGSTGTKPRTSSSSASVSAMSPSSAASSLGSIPPRRSNQACGRPADTSGTPSTSSVLAQSGLWTISADPSFGVPIWDENVVAEVRSYDQLSPVVGLIALSRRRTHGVPRPSRLRMMSRPLTPRPVNQRIRRRAAERPRGLPSPVGRATLDGRREKRLAVGPPLRPDSCVI